jgi:hypothetical protein
MDARVRVPGSPGGQSTRDQQDSAGRPRAVEEVDTAVQISDSPQVADLRSPRQAGPAAASDAIRHFASHERFLRQWHSSAYLTTELLDAVIVPTVRPVANLDDAATVAATVSKRLVVFCSQKATAGAVRARFARAGLDVAAVEVPQGYRHDLLAFATSGDEFRHLSPLPAPRDLSLKRNLGLLLATLLGWEKILFLDDDIYGTKPDDLRNVVAALDSRRIPCFLVESEHDRAPDQPPTEDNSAVCHARRLVGAAQGVFASASALGINCARQLSFFPDIYNEDWFFLLDEIRRSRVTRVGLVRQRGYNPYQAVRARYEEFGDVLAEGLLTHLHLEIPGEPTEEYWAEFLEARGRMLRALDVSLGENNSPFAGAARVAAAAAEIQRQSLTPRDCVRFVECFRADRAEWAKRLEALPRCDSLADALRFLGLHE